MCQLNTRSWAIALAAMLAPPQLASAADHGPVFGLALPLPHKMMLDICQGLAAPCISFSGSLPARC